jgi:hypothetical protein
MKMETARRFGRNYRVFVLDGATELVTIKTVDGLRGGGGNLSGDRDQWSSVAGGATASRVAPALTSGK